ncbi:glycosyltransferase [Flavobacterium endoglycinae]|uniref:Glycosyltransferase n=2 Tax=Flavobacterium TaxID=237 RepID=A0ABX7QA27_9FLAO|nr:glycosyltransferase [Flavobacterium endoglycinae]QSW87481.1 glycosyltransferase [Flavobacterium endoglycinae]
MYTNPQYTVSVDMITYKHERFIKQAIEGVLMQETSFDYELIISDDCSPDNTQEIIEEIKKNHPKGDKIKYFRHKQNIGMQANGTFAFNQCSGKYVALCEGDDYWTDPLKLQKQVDFLEANPEYVLSFHPISILKNDGTIVDDFITNVPKDYETIETLARLGNYIHTPSVVFRNVIAELPFEFQLTPIGDYFLYIILAQYGKLKYLEEKMAVYRYNVGVISKMSNIDIANNNVKMYSCMIGYIKDENVKKIIIDKQIKVVTEHYKQIEASYHNAFVSRNFVFVTIKKINFYSKNPKLFLKRIKKKFKFCFP